MKKILLVFACLLFLGFASQEAMAQKKPKKEKKEKKEKKDKKDKDDKTGSKGNQFIEFSTEAECGECEVLLQDKLLAIKGIKSVSVDLETETIEVRYNSVHVSDTDIKTAILAAGFSADGEKGYKEARKNLPDCCK